MPLVMNIIYSVKPYFKTHTNPCFQVREQCPTLFKFNFSMNCFQNSQCHKRCDIDSS